MKRCWFFFHEWARWTFIDIDWSDHTRQEKRRCNKCGKVQTRWVP